MSTYPCKYAPIPEALEDIFGQLYKILKMIVYAYGTPADTTEMRLGHA